MDDSTDTQHGPVTRGETRPPGAGPWLGRSYVRSFGVVLLVALSALTIAVFVWIGYRTDALVRAGVLAEARSYADLIVAARAWNAGHGGVWVLKAPGVDTNPHLLEMGIDPDREFTSGESLTMRNPAAMTREIGEQLADTGAASVFKLTSQEPVNPDNTPDEWERESLTAFERGVSEAWRVEQPESGAERFRYMQALIVDESCLGCHDSAKYRVGDTRGALSITLPYTAADELRENHIELALIGAGVLAGLWVSLLALLGWLRGRMRTASTELERMATTDALTGLWNRGHTFERLGVEIDRAHRSGTGTGVVLVDIDHFKLFNDDYGHAVGDEVLKRVSLTLREAVRAYDVVGRIGGEELLVIAPEIDLERLRSLAERIRAAVEAMELPAVCAGCSVTVSAGYAHRAPGDDEGADSLVARADRALYAAKDAGRNRVAGG